MAGERRDGSKAQSSRGGNGCSGARWVSGGRGLWATTRQVGEPSDEIYVCGGCATLRTEAPTHRNRVRLLGRTLKGRVEDRSNVGRS